MNTTIKLKNINVPGRYGTWSELDRRQTEAYGTVYYLISDPLGDHTDRIVVYVDADGDLCEIGHGIGRRSSFAAICSNFEII